VDDHVEPPSWLPEGAVPTATDEPLEESAPDESAGEQDSLNGAGAGAHDSPNGVHGHHVTVTAGHEADSEAERGDEAGSEDEAGSGHEAGYEAGLGAEPEMTAEPSAASVFGPDPGPDAPAAEPVAPASSIFVRDPSPPAASAAMFTDEEPAPAAADTAPGEEPAPEAGGPFGAYPFGPATDERSQPGAGDTAGYEPGYVPAYAAETGYNHGMTQPVEDEAAPAPAYPADLPDSYAKGGARPTFARSQPRPKQRSRAAGEVAPARRANLVIARLEPWSVMKFSFLMSLVAWVVLFVAVALLYYALSSLGVFESIQKTLASVTSSTSSTGVNLSKWTSASRVLGYTMLVGAVDVILITALATIGAMVYNLVTHLGGGIEVTLKETD
jgi:Transmembrane domain of unknown function (DUF3566)